MSAVALLSLKTLLSRLQEVDLVFYFSYFHFHFNLILYFLFIELRVRVDGHRSRDIRKGVEGPRRGDIIQHVHCMLASYLTYGRLG